MRQVDLDELTYQIFSGLRSWTPSVRTRVFAPAHKRRPGTRSRAADTICEKLTVWEFLDPADQYRRLSPKEIATQFVAAIDKFPGALASLWLSGQHDRQREAHAAASILLAAALDPIEVLSPTSLDHHGTRMVWFTMPAAPAYAFQAHWP